MRQLVQLKQLFMSKDSQSMVKQSIPVQTLKEKLNQILKAWRNCDQIVDAFVACTQDYGNDGVQASFQKLTTILEFFKCYPVVMKKDKNSSNGIGYVLNAQTGAANEKVSTKI